MPLQVYTSQYRYSGPDRLDITVKSGDQTFAPTWGMVLGAKDGSLSEAEYREQYLDLMRESYRLERDAWDAFLQRERVVLVCFCKPGTFCHRYLLADILVKLGAEYRGEIPIVD